MNSKGNALFLILIAVALFAALSYAVTSSGRGGGGIDREKAAIGAAQISQYIGLIRHEVQRMQLVNDCKAENFDWRNPEWLRLDGSPSWGILHAPLDPKDGCAVFSSYGGPVPANVIFDDLAEPNYNASSPTWRIAAGHALPLWVAKEGTGSSAPDVAIEFRGIAPEICSILLNPAERPDLFNEDYTSDAANLAEPSYSGAAQIIDEPGNSGDFYIHRGISTGGTACFVGAVVLAR